MQVTRRLKLNTSKEMDTDIGTKPSRPASLGEKLAISAIIAIVVYLFITS